MKSKSATLCMALLVVALAVSANGYKLRKSDSQTLDKVSPQVNPSPRLPGSPDNSDVRNLGTYMYKKKLADNEPYNWTNYNDLEQNPQNYVILDDEKDLGEIQTEETYAADPEPYYPLPAEEEEEGEEEAAASEEEGEEEGGKKCQKDGGINSDHLPVKDNDRAPYYDPTEYGVYKKEKDPSLFAVGVNVVSDANKVMEEEADEEEEGEEEAAPAEEEASEEEEETPAYLYQKDPKAYYNPKPTAFEVKVQNLHKQIDRMYDGLVKQYQGEILKKRLIQEMGLADYQDPRNQSKEQQNSIISATVDTEAGTISTKEPEPYYNPAEEEGEEEGEEEF